MKTVFLCTPHKLGELNFQLIERIKKLGFNVLCAATHTPQDLDFEQIFRMNVDLIKKADIFIAVLKDYGKDLTAEVGMAYGWGIPRIGIDFNAKKEDVMSYFAFDKVIKPEQIEEILLDFTQLKYREELKKLNLPQEKFAIFSSGCLAVRNLRENKDIDIIVKEDLWQELSKKHCLNEKGHIDIGNIEVCRKILYLENIDNLIDDAEIIGGFRFVKLDPLLKWKKLMSREKDIMDIELIEGYLKNKYDDL